jgi:S-adenosylmethionine:tRNA ribosyltransferase-isomerase
MKTSDFDFELPKELIAQSPAIPRDSSKLFIYDSKKDKIYHKHFRDIKDFLGETDTLVLNKSKVFPARINFTFNDKILEIFLLERISGNSYKVLVKPGKLFSSDREFFIFDDFSFKVTEILEDGTRLVEFNLSGDALTNRLIEFGKIPFPPYIKNAEAFSENYQTVFCDSDYCKSVAAPTAGLHFTNDLLKTLKEKGVSVVDVVLNVGRGTFLPVKTDDLKDHVMHFEEYFLDSSSADVLNSKKALGSKIVAVGTTSVRVLESSFDNGFKESFCKTNLFIHPGNYKFKVVDALITNFHLPKSTLLMLVATFLENKGVENPVSKLLSLYEEAIREGYRFYSFGDSMFIF